MAHLVKGLPAKTTNTHTRKRPRETEGSGGGSGGLARASTPDAALAQGCSTASNPPLPVPDPDAKSQLAGANSAPAKRRQGVGAGPASGSAFSSIDSSTGSGLADERAGSGSGGPVSDICAHPLSARQAMLADPTPEMRVTLYSDWGCLRELRVQCGLRAIGFCEQLFAKNPVFHSYGADILFLLRNVAVRARSRHPLRDAAFPVGDAADPSLDSEIDAVGRRAMQVVRGWIKRWDASRLGQLKEYADAEAAQVLGAN